MRTGVWLVGARGFRRRHQHGRALPRCAPGSPSRSVASPSCRELRSPALPGLADLVFGGHDVVDLRLVKKAEALAAAGVLPGRLVAALAGELAAVERRAAAAARGGHPGRGRRPRRRRHRRLPRAARPGPGGRRQRVLHRARGRRRTPRTPTWTRSTRRCASGETVLPPSSLVRVRRVHARAARTWTSRRRPGRGCRRCDELRRRQRPAVRRARRQDRRDAGEVGARADVRACATCGSAVVVRAPTCSAAATAPTLADPAADAAQGRQQAAGARRDARVPAGGPARRIDYVAGHRRLQDRLGPDHFEGFLGTRMRMEFTWQGCDSALAAPLVLDLARLTAAAHARRARRAAARARVLLQGPDRRARRTPWPSSGTATCVAWSRGGLPDDACVARPRRAGPCARRADRAG